MKAQTSSPCDGPTQQAAGKAIVLFSDGTGNSSAKLFKTNVWRMYEAIDLGPPADGKRNQISYYDDGVGTSAFKPLALLGGAFGWGLKRNVLEIYRFACRNYRPGDEIYGFGFSRGAFTMRVAIGMIASQGLVQSDDEAQLLQRSQQAYRAFRRDFIPRRLAWPTKLCRQLRDRLSPALARVRGTSPYDLADNVHPCIRFVGVWDTVAAYGGPIVEITRAIDNWVFPLSMPDYHLHETVGCARHALAIDDERDAFQPLLWDEVHEATLVAGGQVSEDRLRQVWFTGMHADVGGGYPDESLSYVSLLWMMEEAESAGLRTLTTIRDGFVALASSAGPLHDSRRGLAAYYRYQPRKIAAWTHPVDGTTLSLRDPLIRDDDGRLQGLLRSVRVHESVIARIATGTDRYAPITLPRQFEIVPPQVVGENAPQKDSEGGTAPAPKDSRPHPLTDPALRARLTDPAAEGARADAVEALWDLVWRRRVAYFLTLGLTLLLLSMPLWVGLVWRAPLLADGRTWIGGLIRLVSLLLPDFAEPWVNTYADNALYFLILTAAILGMMRYSSSCELRLRDRARHIWQRATSPNADPWPTVTPTSLQQFRNGLGYQKSVQTVKWKILPDFAVAPIIALAGLWVLGGAVTQVTLPLLESRSRLCSTTGQTVPELTAARLDFSTRQTCQPVGARVVRGTRYMITFDVVDEWRDSRYSTSPLGLGAGDMRWGLGYLAVPFRRVVKANYLQPAIEIRHPRALRGFNAVHIYPLELAQQGGAQVIYRGQFTAEDDGELLLFANDAVLPFDLRYFYERSGGSDQKDRGNSGTACVTVKRTDIVTDPATPAGSTACASADRRAAAIAQTQATAAAGR